MINTSKVKVKKERLSEATSNGFATSKAIIKSLNGNASVKGVKDEASTTTTTNDKDFEPMYE